MISNIHFGAFEDCLNSTTFVFFTTVGMFWTSIACFESCVYRSVFACVCCMLRAVFDICPTSPFGGNIGWRFTAGSKLRCWASSEIEKCALQLDNKMYFRVSFVWLSTKTRGPWVHVQAIRSQSEPIGANLRQSEPIRTAEARQNFYTAGSLSFILKPLSSKSEVSGDNTEAHKRQARSLMRSKTNMCENMACECWSRILKSIRNLNTTSDVKWTEWNAERCICYRKVITVIELRGGAKSSTWITTGGA